MATPKLTIGMVVCDCRFVHSKIIKIHPSDPDFITVEDGTARVGTPLR